MLANQPTQGGTVLRTITYHQITALTNFGAVAGTRSPVLSADGSKLVFTRSHNSSNLVYTVNFDGSGLILADMFQADCYCDADVDISADGSKVIGFDGGLVRMANADGTNPHQVIRISSFLDCRISPDGTKVYFMSSGNFSTYPNSGAHEAGIYVVNADGSGLHEIGGLAGFAAFLGTTPGALGWNTRPFGISGDGSRLVCFIWSPVPSSRYALLGLNTDGTSLHELTLAPTAIDAVYKAGLSGDGSKAYYYFRYAPCCSSGEEVGVINWDGSGRRVLLSNYSTNQSSSGLAVSQVTLNQDGSKLLCGDRGCLINTDGSGQLALSWSTPGLANYVLDVGFYRGIMDAAGTRFAYLTTAGGSYYQVAVAELNPASLGLAPALVSASATPAYVTTNGPSPVFAVRLTPTNSLVSSGVQEGILLNGLADPADWVGGRLHDDSLNGDSAKGDGVYSDNIGMFFSPPSVGPRTLRFKAEVLGADGHYHASAIDLAPFFVVNRAPTNPPPAIISISPSNAPPGTQITITGTGFDPSPTNNVVLVGDVPVQVVSVNPTGTQLVVVVPPGLPPGPVTVTVSIPGQTSNPYNTGGGGSEEDWLELMMLAGVNIHGVVGRNYRIDYLADLRNTNSWEPLTTLALQSNPYFWVDLSSTNQPKRFYRSVRVP